MLKQLSMKPPAELSLLSRALLWVFKNEVSGAATIGILFAVGMSLRRVISIPDDAQRFARGVIVLLIFGVFVGVIAVTEDNKEFRDSGSRIRITCGAISFAAIAVILSAPMEGVVLAALAGALLGYFGKYWAQYV